MGSVMGSVMGFLYSVTNPITTLGEAHTLGRSSDYFVGLRDENTHNFFALELEKTRLELEQLKLDSEVPHLATAPENCGKAVDLGIKTSRMITLGATVYF